MNNPLPDPGSEHARQKLVQLLADGRAIAFVGAGASAGLYPLWNQLIAQLADEAVRRGLPPEEDWKALVEEEAVSQPQDAVREIRRTLTDGIYYSQLQSIFGPRKMGQGEPRKMGQAPGIHAPEPVPFSEHLRTGSDGRTFTAVHEQLLRLPFRGYVTTNYDPGLLEARRAVRPQCADRDDGTWQDESLMHRWLTDDLFLAQACPILFLHGFYERPKTIVLGSDEYREAYKAGLMRAVFEKLWTQQRLVFVGFGFSDPWMNFLANEVLTQIDARTVAEPRHIAILGTPDGKSVSPMRRRALQDRFHALLLTYPVKTTPDGGQDHSQLLELLRSVAPAAVPVTRTHVPSPPRQPLVPREYTEWLLARCGEIELMGLDIKHGSGVRLNHVYTPLTTSALPKPGAKQERR
jgi:hypothetical protein